MPTRASSSTDGEIMNICSEHTLRFPRRTVSRFILNTSLFLLSLSLGAESLSQDLGGATRPAPDLKVFLLWGADTTAGPPVGARKKSCCSRTKSVTGTAAEAV